MKGLACKLALAHQKLREYAILVADRATTDERNRVAREIHDSVGHVLTAQSIQLDNAIAFWQIQPTKAYDFLTESKKLVSTALKEIRHSVTTLRADPLQGKNLEDAIAFLEQQSQLPDVVLLDVRMPVMDGVATTLELKNHYPEINILNLIATGANNREIAKNMYNSEKTVKNHITSIFSKLNLRDRTQAALLARSQFL